MMLGWVICLIYHHQYHILDAIAYPPNKPLKTVAVSRRLALGEVDVASLPGLGFSGSWQSTIVNR